MFELQGNVEKLVRNNHDEDLIVFKVMRDDKSYTCRYNGFLPLDTNDAISLRGKLTENEILITEKPYVIIPTNRENIKNCITKALKGKKVGSVKSERLYGELYRDQESPNRDSKIVDFLNKMCDPVPKDFKFDNLTVIQTSHLLNWWNRHFSKRRLYLLGLFDSEIRRSKMSESKLYSTLKDNPFKVFSISNDKAKEICNMMKKKISQKDLKCGEICRFIIEFLSRGWTGCPENIVEKSFPEFSLYREHMETAFEMVFSKGLIYTHRTFLIEFETTERVNEMIRFTVEEKKKELEMPDISDGYTVFHEDRIVLTDEQEAALKGGLGSYISIITGGAGCGKTTLIKQLIRNFRDNDEKFILTSFTGKAVLRIKESLGSEFSDIPCHTLHRIIHRKNTMQHVVKFYNVIIDECSMISTELIWEFLIAFRHKFRLIMIGDSNQLPPIGLGSFFTELIASKRIPIHYLTQNKRLVEGKNTVLENANGLISPDRDKKSPFLFSKGEGFYINEGNIDYCIAILEKFKSHHYNSDDITVITPFNKIIDKIVEEQQRIFLSDREHKRFGEKTYYVGDRVMQTKNVYNDEFDLMNGEEGYIINISAETFTVDYGMDKKVEYFWAMRPDKTKAERKKDIARSSQDSEEVKSFYTNDVSHSFCKTVHKSQGSEYRFVVFFVPRSTSSFVNVNLLYTGMTRTKEKIWMVGDLESLEESTTRYPPFRYEKLSERLQEMRQEDEAILNMD